MRILVTGGCGFVGSAVVRMAVERGDHVLNLDRRKKSVPVPALGPLLQREGYARLEADVRDQAMVRAVMHEFAPDAVIHLAAANAEDPAALVDGEIGAAFAVLEASRHYFDKLKGAQRDRFRIVQAERADAWPPENLSPANAVRASAVTLADRWSRAYGLPLATCLAGEAFGPWQHGSSFFGRLLTGLLHHQSFAVPDGGETVRDWLPVRDLASGLLCAAAHAEPQSRHELSVGAERRDIDLAEAVCGLLDERLPCAGGQPWSRRLSLDRPGPSELSGPMLEGQHAEHALQWRPLGFHAGLDRLLSWAVASHAASQARYGAPAHA